MRDRAKAGRRIYQDIAHRLTEEIASGVLAEGSRLPSERALAERFKASRTSVREALLALQAAGLISVSQRSRAKVTPLSTPAFFAQLSAAAKWLLRRPSGVADFQEARILFECSLARYAAHHASPKEIERLALALAENKRALGKPTVFVKTDAEFHGILAEIPRNPIFPALNKALCEWLMEQRTVGISVRGAARRAYEGHKKVYEAIAAHDPEAADRAMSEHLKKVSEYYHKANSPPQ